jgi:RND family efflux transporter MFP subunit
MRVALISVLIAASLAGVWYWSAANSAVRVEAATVATAYPSQSVTVLNATGYVVAQRKASTASKATGRLVWLGVVEGSRVKEGEIVARLESNDVSATLEQARANVKLAQANLEQARAEQRDAEAAMRRSRSLVDAGAISRADNDAAAARLAKANASISGLQAAIGVAQANVKSAEVAVDQTLIRAPFNGVILTKHANVGDVVTPFSSALDTKGAVVTMADMDTLEVEADVSESNLGKVQPGQPAEIQLDALPGIRLAGEVHRIVPTVDRSKATVLAKIRFLETDPRVLPEMSAKVAFLSERPSEQQPRVVAPPSAIVEHEGRPTAFVIDGETVRTVAVETGARVGEMIEIVKGLQPGDKIVSRPPDQLKDGGKITLEKSEAAR